MKLQRSVVATALALFALTGSACGDDDKPNGDGGGPRDSGRGDASTGDAGRATDAAARDGSTRADASSADACVGDCDPAGDIDAATDAGQLTPESGTDTPDSAAPGQADTGTDVAPDAGVTTCSPSAVAPTIPKLKLEAVPGVGTLDTLIFAAQPPGSSDWYLVQQRGTIRVLSGGVLQPDDFLDVSAQIAIAGDDERGLLGLAFAPDYAQSGKLYVMMTPTTGALRNHDVVLEYTRTGGVAASPKQILDLQESEINHNGGTLAFGPDGFLYVGTGDGGAACNTYAPGGPQDVSWPFGKILRLDPKAAPPYAAAGNPFASEGDPRVYHYGLRNPYRFAFDRATGDLYIGDVGQDSYEEFSFAASGTSGLNFGWPKREGSHADTCPGRMLRPGSTATDPIVDVDRRPGATGPFGDYKSAISGPVYRGSAIPELRGVYLFGDYVGTRMGALIQCGTTSPVTPILKNSNPNEPNAAAFSREAGLPPFSALTAIVEDGAGELYFVANRSRLLKVVAQ
jgi:glucose/arabinose dehydrogenase